LDDHRRNRAHMGRCHRGSVHADLSEGIAAFAGAHQPLEDGIGRALEWYAAHPEVPPAAALL
jgi:hypothetical protein